MPTYSTVAILYITTQSISLISLLCLMYLILKSKPYFTKWTLFQICISAFGGGLANIPPIIFYGDDLTSRAFDTPICIASQKVSLYFLYPFEFTSCVLAFYLWYSLVKKNTDIEKKCFWYISSAIWIFTTVYNGILLKFASEQNNWGVYPSSLDCKTSNIVSSFYGYVISTSILVFVAVLLSCHSAFILHKRWSHFSMRKNRRTAIRLGEAVRLCVWCFTFAIVLTIPLIPRAIQRENPISDYTNISTMSSFCTSVAGLLLFLIFGTNKKAAYFLPFYYVPPDKLQPSFTLPDELPNDQELSGMAEAHLKPKTNDMNDMDYFNDKSSSHNSLYDDYIGGS